MFIKAITPLLLLLLLGCNTSEKKLIGLYKSHPKTKITGSSIRLNPDGTYLYKAYLGDIFKMHIDGFWRLSQDKKHITFNSLVPSADSLLRVEEKRNDNLNGKVKITAYYSNGEQVIGDLGFKTYTNTGHSYYKSYQSGLIYDDTLNITKFTVQIIGLGQRVPYHTVKNPHANEYIIYFRLENNDDYRFFLNQTWLVKHKKLVDTDTVYNRLGKADYYKVQE